MQDRGCWRGEGCGEAANFARVDGHACPCRKGVRQFEWQAAAGASMMAWCCGKRGTDADSAGLESQGGSGMLEKKEALDNLVRIEILEWGVNRTNPESNLTKNYGYFFVHNCC